MKREIGVYENLYLIAYFTLVIKYLLQASLLVKNLGTADKIMNAVFLSLILIKLLTQSYTLVKFMIIAAVGLVCLYSSVRAGYSSGLNSFLCLIALQGVDLKKVLKISCLTKAVAILIHVAIYVVIYNTDPSVIQFVYRAGVKRHFFFLGHANFFTALLIWAFLEWIYIYYERIKTRHLILIWIINFVFYQFTDSNTGLYIITLTSLLILLEKHKTSIFKKLVPPIAKYGFLVCSIVFCFLAAVYTNLNAGLMALWEAFNEFQTGRILYGAYAYDVYGFTLFGRSINFPQKVYWRGYWLDNILFDNSYIWQFIIFGVASLAIVSLAFILLEKRMTNIEKIIVIAYTFFAIMENYVVNVIICFPLLIIGRYIYQSKIKPAKIKPLTKELPLWKRRKLAS